MAFGREDGVYYSFIEMEMSPVNLCHQLHWKLSQWQLPVQAATKFSFRFGILHSSHENPFDTISAAVQRHWTQNCPDSKVHGANTGPIWGRQDPGGPHVGPMNFAIWVISKLTPN